jgi:hypothetical protein
VIPGGFEGCSLLGNRTTGHQADLKRALDVARVVLINPSRFDGIDLLQAPVQFG